MLFFQVYGLLFLFIAEYAKAQREPTSGYCDAYSVGTPQWAFLGETRAEKP